MSYNNINLNMSETQQIVQIYTYSGKQLAQRNMFKFVDAIYYNFNNLSYENELNHTKKEILRLLISPRTIILLAIFNGKIIAYLIAEINIQKNRKIMHIYYLYTAFTYRGKGLGSHLINDIEKIAKEFKINTLSLTFDTHNESLKKFYLDHYFEFDPEFRSNKRFDMLIKYI